MTMQCQPYILADSYGTHSPRLTTMFAAPAKMIIGERNRHRMFSLSDRSSRAVPTRKLIAEVRERPAMPAKFKKNVPGMAGGEELTGWELRFAELRWNEIARKAASIAEEAADAGEAKETANRHLDPYIHFHTVMTGVEDCWLNFFGLRLDKHADPTIVELAEACWAVWNEGNPQKLAAGEWHLPLVDAQDYPEIWKFDKDGTVEYLKKVSAGRCAHTSYLDFETNERMTIEKALKVYAQLVDKKHALHASPLEHQATPDRVYIEAMEQSQLWCSPELHGNLPGWIQFRKTLSGEAVAALPEGYEKKWSHP